MNNTRMTDTPDLEAAAVRTNAAPKGALSIIFLIVLLDLFGFGVIIPRYLPTPDYMPHPTSRSDSSSRSTPPANSDRLPILGTAPIGYGRRPCWSSPLPAASPAISARLRHSRPMANTGSWPGLIYLSRVIDGISGGNISTAKPTSAMSPAKRTVQGHGFARAASHRLLPRPRTGRIPRLLQS